MEIRKEEIAKTLLKVFKDLEEQNNNVQSSNVYSSTVKSEIIKENALAMCEIANTLNNIKN